MSPLLAFATAGAITYALRASMLVAGPVRLPARLDAVLALLPPAVVAAIIASAVFTDGSGMVTPDPAAIVALAVAFVVARRTGVALHAFTVGLPVFWLAETLVAA